MTRSFALIVAAWCATAIVAGAQERPAPDALARSLQQRYEHVADFSADFTQVYRGSFSRTETRRNGTLLVKRPGRMRWTYAGKEQGQELIFTGDRIIHYDPSEKVAEITTQDATSAGLFLAGQGDLVRDFAIEYVDSPVAGAAALKLTPRSPQPGYEHLVVAVDPDTLQVRALVTIDIQGESTLLFTNLRENRGIADREFDFRIPRGVEVIDETVTQ